MRLNAVSDVLCYREGSAYSRRRVSSVNATSCILREKPQRYLFKTSMTTNIFIIF